MKTNEKKLLLLFGALFVLVVLVRVIPLVSAYYQDGRDEIALLSERVSRYQQLISDTDDWAERELLKQAEIAEYANWVFEGSNPSLVGTSVQRAIRQAGEKAGINVREMSVAQFAYVGDWIKVSQDMSISLNQQNILPFLQSLNEMRPRLFVSSFTVNRNRRDYSGSITVVGFAREQDSAELLTANTMASEGGQ